jgi:hypothetical protein
LLGIHAYFLGDFHVCPVVRQAEILQQFQKNWTISASQLQ